MSSVIVDFVRSPFTPAHKGGLAKTRPDDLMAWVVQGLLSRNNIKPEAIEDLLIGCAFPEGEQGMNLGRIVGFLAGLPVTVAGATINRFCGSSMEAVHIAVGKIALGAGELFIAGGVESMTRIPIGGYNLLPNPSLYKNQPEAYMSMGLTAEEVATRCEITRKAQEEFALLSHQRALQADFSDEIIAIGAINKDECIRSTSLEALAALSPVFKKDGSVTAGTASALTDGACALLIASEATADKNNLPKLARIRSQAVVGLAPEIMGLGPVAAAQKALQRAGLTLQDMDVIELNEAFAVQAIACLQKMGLDQERVNIEGGAIALGHPLGASGARITGKAAQLLKRNNGKYALAAMCIGGGQGIATVLERI